jgi:archaellum biogenesis protein FlaJ (TadC family)
MTGFVFACMGFKNEQAKKVQEFESMPLVCISFSISEFIVIVILFILIIVGIKEWILVIIGIVLFALCFSFFFVYNDRFQNDPSSQNCGTNSQEKCGKILSDGIENYYLSMMLAFCMIMFVHAFLIPFLCSIYHNRKIYYNSSFHYDGNDFDPPIFESEESVD